MTETETPVAPETGGTPETGSLKQRAAERRAELQKEQHFDIPVPGYEDLFVARYTQLGYHVLRHIGKGIESEPDEIQREIDLAAATLVNACQGLYEAKPDGSLEPTGYRWTTTAALELFGVPESELPPGSTARAALLAVLESDTVVVRHFAEYSELSVNGRRETDEVLKGESEAV
jgi:hypothetical protein